MHANHQDLYDQIKSTGKLPDGNALDEAITSFKDTFETSDQKQAKAADDQQEAQEAED